MTSNIPDTWRDREAEGVLVGDCLIHPDQTGRYREAGATEDLFDTEAHRVVWRALVSLLADGRAPDHEGVRAWLTDHRLFDRIGLPRLSALGDGVPRQSADGIVAAVARLRVLASCRAVAYRSNRLLAELTRDPSAMNNGALSGYLADLEKLRTEAPSASRLPCFDDVTILDRPPAEFLVAGRIVERSLVLLFGESGSGKTWLALDLGFSIAAGQPWLGAEVRGRGPTAYVVAEDADTFGSRIVPWKTAHHVPTDQVVGLHIIPEAVQLMDADQVSRLIATLTPLSPVLVVIDTYAKTTIGAEENSATDTGLILAACDHLRRSLGCVVVLVHHTNAAGTRERGSSALRAAVDAAFMLSQADDLLTLTCVKQRNAAPFEPLRLRLVPPPTGDGLVVRLASEVLPSHDLTGHERRALEVLRDQFLSDGASATEWQRATSADVPERSFFRVKKVLVDRGLVRQAGPRFVLVNPGPSAHPPTPPPQPAPGRPPQTGRLLP